MCASALFIRHLPNHRIAFLFRFWRQQYTMIKIDFWLDAHSQPMTTSYNYTGYYAVQINHQNSSAASAFATHQFSNIPGNGITPPTTSSVSLQVNDQLDYGTGTLTLSGYSSVQILSVNVILYYQVYFAQLDKSVLSGLMWNAAGNLISGSVATNLEFVSSSAISKQCCLDLGLYRIQW